jgi:glycosyltransferase involved in cell wall biosynthesis
MGYTGKPLHIVHLSYTVPRPNYRDPNQWLDRVAFVTGVPEKLAGHGPQTVIFNIDYEGELQKNGVKYLFPRFKKAQLLLPFAFNRYVRKLKPDVVLVHGLIFPGQVIMLRETLGPNVKIICQHHAERPFKDLRRYLAMRADRSISAYLFASKEQGNEWVGAGQISSINKVHEVIGTSSIFRLTNNHRDGKVYLWIGDLDHNKDPLVAARAFARFSAGKNVSLYMIFQQRLLEDQLRKIITPSIHLVGGVEHAKLQEWFNRASYIISTSHYEGSGIAVIEGMSCGCYPILTNIPSFRAMTDNGRIGRLFEAGDEDQLTNALEESFNSSRAEEIVSHFHDNLSFEANALRIVNIINTL